MSELLKIAGNGQWSLEKAEQKPRVTVFRGMNQVTAKHLQKLGIAPTTDPRGAVSPVDLNVGMKKMGWWSDNPRFTMMYAAMDPVNKKILKEPEYDVFMVGDTEHPGGDKNLTPALRDADSTVHVHTIVHVPTRGSSDERAAAIQAHLPHIPWVKPKGDLNKSKFIKPEGFGLPKNPNLNFVNTPRQTAIVSQLQSRAIQNAFGVYRPFGDSTNISTQNIKDYDADVNASQPDVSRHIDNLSDTIHHEHQHRLNQKVGEQLKYTPEDPVAGTHGRAFSSHLWNNSGLLPQEQEAIRHISRLSGGSADPDNHEEHIASLIGWLNAGKANRQDILDLMSSHTAQGINFHMGVGEIEPHLRSALVKLRNTASQLKPGQVIPYFRPEPKK